MKTHTIFIEPANYTQDLIKNVYQKLDRGYSFLHSNSVATNDARIISSAKHPFDKNSLLKNIVFLWKCSKQNDLVIINGYNHSSFIFLFLFANVNSCYIAIESDTPYRTAKGIKGLLKKIYLKFIFSNKQVLGLPGGKGLHRDLFLNYGMPGKRIFFLPMMVNNAIYYKPIVDVPLNTDTVIKFIFVGRLIPEKNLGLLVKSFQAVLKQGKKAELDIIGEGICKTELQELIGGTKEIKLKGKKFGSDLLQAYRHAHVMVLPSCNERWGLVVNEALAAGLPVLGSSAVGAANDLILNPDAGWVFKDNNEMELTEILTHIIDNPLQIHEKGKRGQDFMVNYWNYDLYIQCLHQLFDYVKKT